MDEDETKESRRQYAKAARQKEKAGEPKRAYGDWRKSVMDEYRECLGSLSPFQRRFVEAYLKAGSGAEAARIAGSQSKNLEQVAHNTKRLPEVQKAIAIGMDTRIQAAALDDMEVIHMMREVYHKAIEDKRYAEANKAAENLAKTLGLFQLSSRETFDDKVAKRAKDLRDDKAKEREIELDENASQMLQILGNAKAREGTAVDTRNIEEFPGKPDED